MTNLLKQTHTKAFLTNFEIACEAGIIALAADLIWLTHDIIANGLSVTYVVVGTGLFVGLVLTTFAAVRHHMHYTHRLVRSYRARKAIYRIPASVKERF